MKRMFRKWELVVAECVRQGEECVLALVTLDAIAAIFTVGVITIFSAVVEAFIGAPNWPELVLAWLVVYIACFNVVIEATAYSLCRDELGCDNDYMIRKYVKERFDEEL